MADPKIRYDILANASGAESVDRLAAELQKLDDALDPAAAARAKALANEIRELGAQQAAVQRFRELKEQTAAASVALDTAQAAAQKLGQQLAASEAPTRAETGQMQKLRDAVSAAKTELQAKTVALDAARGNLTQFGIATDAVARKEIDLRSAVQNVRQEIQQLGQQGQAVQRFQELGAAVETARSRLAAADTVLEAFRVEMAGVAEPTRAQTQRLQQLSESARSAQVAFQASTLAQAQAGTALRAAGVDTQKLTAEQGNLVRQSASLRQAAANVGTAHQQQAAQVQSATEAVKKQTSAVGTSVDEIAKGFGRLGAAAAGAFTGREFIETITQAEGLKRGLEAVTGSTAKAGETLAYLKRTSNELGLEVQSAGKAFLSLTAATQGTALEGEPTRQVFEAISRAMSTLGKSGVETERALQAVAQMASKGTVSMEELRGQLGEALPGALKAAADGAGITTKQLIDMVGAGNVLAKDLLPALTKGLNDLYANGGPPDTLNANWNRLKNTLTDTAVALGEGGLGTLLKNAAGGAAVAVTATDEAVVLLGRSLGEYVAALTTGNFALGTYAERTAAADAKLNALARTAGLAAPEVAKIGTAADEAGRRARDSFNKFERAAESAGAESTKLGTTTVDLVAKFDTLRQKGDSAAEAIGKIGKDLDLSSSKGIVQAEDTLNRLRLNGEATAEQISEAWRTGLAGIDLAEFEARARAAFAGSVGEARKLKEVTDAIGDESLRRAGTSLKELTTGYSAAATRAITDFDALAKTIQGLGVKSDETSRALTNALDKALAAANTERAIQAVIDRMQAAGKQGLISGEQMAEGLEKARQKADDLKAGVNSLDEALRDFGLKTRGELQQTADKLTAAWQQIQNSTTVSLADQRKAFEQWAAAVTAANGGVETEAVKVARAMLEIKEAAANAGKGIVDSMGRGQAAVVALGNAVASASASLDKFNARSTSTLNDANNQIGNGINGGFGTLANSDGNLSIPAGYMFDEAAYDRALQNYFRNIGSSSTHVTAPNAQDYVVANPTIGGTKPHLPGNGTNAGTSLYGSSSSSSSTASTPAATTSTSAAQSSTHTVNVSINGQTQVVNTASLADSQALVKMIQTLEAAARSSGTQVQT